MNKDFDVDEEGLTVDGYHVLEPVSKNAMYLRNAIAFIIVALISAVVVVFREDIFLEYVDVGMLATMAIFVLIAIYLIVSPSVYYRRYRYRMDDDKVEVRQGIITITHDMVPIERVHQVKISRGPINRRYGLANVLVTTAGGTVSLSYLKEDVAEGIASKLNDKIIEMLKKRD
ncbi:MAG: PH domain-containing protein [Candidatus Methanomethylophilaceae archaeon]